MKIVEEDEGMSSKNGNLFDFDENCAIACVCFLLIK
jgi:hypothetical protein